MKKIYTIYLFLFCFSFLKSFGQTDLKYISTLGSRGASSIGILYRVVTDKAGNIFFSDIFNNRLVKLSADGTFIKQVFPGSAVLAIDTEGNIYIYNKKLVKYDNDLNIILSFGKPGFGDQEFDNPKNISIDTLGNIFVSGNKEFIQKFDKNGQFLEKFV